MFKTPLIPFIAFLFIAILAINIIHGCSSNPISDNITQANNITQAGDL